MSPLMVSTVLCRRTVSLLWLMSSFWSPLRSAKALAATLFTKQGWSDIWSYFDLEIRFCSFVYKKYHRKEREIQMFSQISVRPSIPLWSSPRGRGGRAAGSSRRRWPPPFAAGSSPTSTRAGTECLEEKILFMNPAESIAFYTQFEFKEAP